MENIFFWIVVGVVAGWMAKMVVPGEAPGGILGDLVIGIFGAIAGGYLFDHYGGRTYGGWLGNIGVAFVGAVILLAVLRLISGRRLSPS